VHGGWSQGVKKEDNQKESFGEAERDGEKTGSSSARDRGEVDFVCPPASVGVDTSGEAVPATSEAFFSAPRASTGASPPRSTEGFPADTSASAGEAFGVAEAPRRQALHRGEGARTGSACEEDFDQAEAVPREASGGPYAAPRPRGSDSQTTCGSSRRRSNPPGTTSSCAYRELDPHGYARRISRREPRLPSLQPGDR